LKVKERIREWLKKVKEEGKPVEVITFYQEIPIRVKTRLLDFDDNFLQWEAEPKLCLGVSDCKKLYFYFSDPYYGQRRLLSADVNYHGSSMVETTFPLPSQEPKLNRECLRVKTSESLPVRVFVIDREGQKREFKVWDLSEEGIGIVGKPGSLNPGEEVRLELRLPQGELCVKGEVVSAQPEEEGERYGIRLLIKENETQELRYGKAEGSPQQDKGGCGVDGGFKGV